MYAPHRHLYKVCNLESNIILQMPARILRIKWTFSHCRSVPLSFPFIQLNVDPSSLYVWPQKGQWNRWKKVLLLKMNLCHLQHYFLKICTRTVLN